MTTRSPELLDALIASRVAHLRLLAAQTAQAYWRDQPGRMPCSSSGSRVIWQKRE